ncbi:MAG: hypothetical protein WCX81_01215 [Monoglobales bacterium]
MAFFDWNGNGEKDFADDFIEYNIYKQSTTNSDDSQSSSDGCGCLFLALIIFAVLSFIGRFL